MRFLGDILLGVALAVALFITGLTAQHPLGVFFAISAGLFAAELWHRATDTP